jgi:hypothetical protein
MTLSSDYARALYELTQKDTSRGSEYLKNLKDALKRRGHEKLLSKIFTDYESLTLKEKRSKAHRTVTREQERTRVLLELYKKLVETPTTNS